MPRRLGAYATLAQLDVELLLDGVYRCGAAAAAIDVVNRILLSNPLLERLVRFATVLRHFDLGVLRTGLETTNTAHSNNNTLIRQISRAVARYADTEQSGGAGMQEGKMARGTI